MKRRDLVRHLERHGCELHREGSRHSVYVNRAAKKASSVPRRSDALDGDSLGVGCERLQVTRIGRQNRSAGLGHRDDQRVDRRATSCACAKQGRSSRKALWDPIDHVAGLEQSVFVRVSPGMPSKALDKDDGRNRGRPQALLQEGKNERRRRAGSLGEATDGSRIQNEQELARLAGRALGDSLRKRFRSGSLMLPRLTNLGEQAGSEAVGLREQVETTYLGSNGVLQ